MKTWTPRVHQYYKSLAGITYYYPLLLYIIPV